MKTKDIAHYVAKVLRVSRVHSPSHPPSPYGSPPTSGEVVGLFSYLQV